MVKNRILKTKLITKLLVLTAFLGFVFVNCSDVKISTNPSVDIAQAKPEIEMCSYANTQKLQDKLKVAFIIDMSGSNVRDIDGPATDNVGDRLKAIKKFIVDHKSFEYIIIPFSDNILPGTTCGDSAAPSYKTSDASLIDIDNLITVQDNEPRVPNPPKIMRQTYYHFALECAQQTLLNENIYYNTRLPEYSEIHYKSFFVTDGQPTDASMLTEMLASVTQMSFITAKAAEFQMIPVYYGATNQTAFNILKQIGQAGNWVNPPNNDPLLTNNVANLDFDKLLSYTINEQHKILEFNIVNLTAVARNGYLLPDSDMDGLPDIDDPSPQNRRSNPAYLLDGICSKVGQAFCKKPPSCDQSKFNAVRFNECDMYALNLTDGLDSDSDNIPDLVEYLQRLNPGVNDAFTDSDNDGVQNIVESRSGNQIDNPMQLPYNETFIWNRVLLSESSSSCPHFQDYWRIDVSQIPTVPVKAFVDLETITQVPNTAISLSHDIDENVFFVYYIQQLVNGDPKTPVRAIYGKVLRIKKGTSVTPELKPEDFERIGDLDGNAKLFQGVAQ